MCYKLVAIQQLINLANNVLLEFHSPVDFDKGNLSIVTVTEWRNIDLILDLADTQIKSLWLITSIYPDLSYAVVSLSV